MNRPLHAATSVALQFCVLLLMGCSSGVLSFQAHDPLFGKSSPTEIAGGSLSIAQWVPSVTRETEIFSVERAYLYRPSLAHLARRGATLHEIQSGPYARNLLYFGGKDQAGDWITNAVIVDSVTHEIVRIVPLPDDSAMYNARAIEITQGVNSSRVILVSDQTELGMSVRVLVIDLSREEPGVGDQLLTLPDSASLSSLTEVRPSADHDLGHVLLVAETGSGSTAIWSYDLSEVNLMDDEGVWENTGTVSAQRTSPRFFDLSKTNTSGTSGPLIMTPSDATGDTNPEVLFVRRGGSWQTLALGSSGVGCAGVGSHFLAPQYGSSAGNLVRVSGRPTGTAVNGNVPTEDQCRRSMEVIRFSQVSAGGGGVNWSSARLVFQSGMIDPSNGTSGGSKIVEIRSGPWAGDFVISPSLEGDLWNFEQSTTEELRRVRLRFDGAVWSVSESVAELYQQSGGSTVDLVVERRQPQLVALSDGRTAIAGGECSSGGPSAVCVSKIAMHSAYAPIKVDVMGSQEAVLEVLEGLQDKFSMRYASNPGRWILFPKSSIASHASNFKLRASHGSQLSNTLHFTIESGPL